MASSLIMHKRIRTTLAKAKALRTYVEPIITRSKEDTTHNRREVFSYLQDNKAVTELFRVVSQKVADRPGGYTRILKLENRLGDNAQMCFIELVDFNEIYLKEDTGKKAAKRTRRGATKKVSEKTDESPVATAVVAESAAPPAITDEKAESIVEKEIQAPEVDIEPQVVAESGEGSSPDDEQQPDDEEKNA